VPVYEITHGGFVPLRTTSFAEQGLRERGDLQRLLRSQIEIIAPGVLIVGEEFGEWEDSRRRIDLLGVDRDGSLVVIELKRTEDGGHMELQAIRYAAMVSQMTFEKVTEVFGRYLAANGREDDPRQLLLDFLAWDVPNADRFAQDVRIVLASAEFSKELTTAVLWLNEKGLDIRCVRLSPHTDGNRVFVDVQQVLPLPEASEYFVNLREKQSEERQARRREEEWSGLWFVNVGMHDSDYVTVDASGRGSTRNWENCIRYGYLAAGGGPRYSGPLKRLDVGSKVLAYQKGKGYVGYGIVASPAAPIHLLRLEDGRTLAEALNQKDMNSQRPEENWEHAVGVRWLKSFPLSDARTFRGVFANQNVVCKLSDVETIRFVREQFEIAEQDSADVDGRPPP
jgi:hypothetical protein